MEQRTFGAAGAAAAAGTGFVINAPKNLMLAALGPGGTGPLPLPFLVPVPAAFFLMDVEPAGRPAPGLGPPEWPLVPGMAGRWWRRAIGAQCVNPKKDVGHSDLYKERDVAHQLRI